MSCFPKLNQEFKIRSKDFWNERSNIMENRGIFKIAYRKRSLMSLELIQLRKGFFGGLITELKSVSKQATNQC